MIHVRRASEAVHERSGSPHDRLTSLDLLDLIVLLLVLAAVVGSLRRGGGVLSAVAAGASTLVLLWVVAVAVTAWAPGPVARVAADSVVLRTVPVPRHALDQVGQLLGLSRDEGTPPKSVNPPR